MGDHPTGDANAAISSGYVRVEKTKDGVALTRTHYATARRENNSTLLALTRRHAEYRAHIRAIPTWIAIA